MHPFNHGYRTSHVLGRVIITQTILYRKMHDNSCMLLKTRGNFISSVRLNYLYRGE